MTLEHPRPDTLSLKFAHGAQPFEAVDHLVTAILATAYYCRSHLAESLDRFQHGRFRPRLDQPKTGISFVDLIHGYVEIE
jgi:hypothetical protein